MSDQWYAPNQQCVGTNPASAAEATGATAGTPGTFTPAGSLVPLDIYELGDDRVKASPATPWTVGQHVVLGDASQATWSGTNWVGGVAPLAAPEPAERAS